jgi:folate-binding protein YgfZ
MTTNATSAQTPSPAAAAVLAPANRWQASAADRTAFASGPVLAALADQAVIDFSGADTLTFLQGQTTIDVAALVPSAWQLGGYCTPKGRLLAIFLAWRAAEGVRMLLPSAIAASIQRRLAMFVLRAKVQIGDASAAWVVLGVFGTGAGAALARAGIEVPTQPWESRALDAGEQLVCLPGAPECAERLLLVVRAERLAHWRETLQELVAVGPELWWWSQIVAAVPAITAGMQELFVPQSLNLEVLGGVNFRKGCYPGQEIVARSQYLGKLRRRMFLAHAPALGPVADIFADGHAEPVGRIVLAATAPNGEWDLLFECPIDRAQGVVLRAGAGDAPPLQLRPLPYALFDPTA